MMISLLLLMIHGTSSVPSDIHATAETRQLYTKLLHLTRDHTHVLFGQQKATQVGAEGGHDPYNTKGLIHDNGIQGWSFTTLQAERNLTDDLCDIKRLTGEYPAVIGFDIGKMEPDDLTVSRYLIQKAAERGSVITVSWHMINPITNGRPWIDEDHGNFSHSIRRILPGGDHHIVYIQKLHVIANWIKSLHFTNGKRIPILFRIFHEMNGGWFWWGTSNKVGNTVRDFKQLWKFTVDYLRNSTGVHNALYAFTPSKLTTKTESEYLHFYPGDQYVDLLGLDFYFDRPFHPSLTDFQHELEVLVRTAKSKNKPAALTEVGLKNNGIGTHQNFWTDHVLNVLKKGRNTLHLSYILAWSNYCHHDGTCSIWVPYRGHRGEQAFLNFYRDPVSVFQQKMTSVTVNHNIFG